MIVDILTSEIEKFATNLIRGQLILENYFKENASSKNISGDQAFKLYDTFGFPIELVYARAREKGYTVDTNGFQKEMEKQQTQSGKKLTDPLDHIEFPATIHTEFTGYQELQTASSINALIEGLKAVDHVPAGTTCWVLTKKSPFFIVGGGQVPDQGWLLVNKEKIPITQVRYINGRIAAQITTPFALKTGMKVISIVDEAWRINAMKNHTATHLLQAALIELFGKQIKQSGSLVHPDYLRFDFTYHAQLNPEDIKRIEDLVNAKIRENIPVTIEHTPFKEAVERGVLAFFGEKYNPEKVRIVAIADFSKELCGGTHVARTGDIGAFKITEVSSIAAGHRRIIALTGPKAIELFQDTFNTVKNISSHFNIKREQIIETIEKQTLELKELQKQVKLLKHHAWQSKVQEWLSQTKKVHDIPFVFVTVKNSGHDELKDMAHLLQEKQPGLYMLVSTIDDRSLFLVSIADQLSDKVNLQKFASFLKDKHSMRGGGSKNTLQGGGGKFDPRLQDAIVDWLKNSRL